jgi:hypothetical protein
MNANRYNIKLQITPFLISPTGEMIDFESVTYFHRQWNDFILLLPPWGKSRKLSGGKGVKKCLGVNSIYITETQL